MNVHSVSDDAAGDAVLTLNEDRVAWVSADEARSISIGKAQALGDPEAPVGQLPVT